MRKVEFYEYKRKFVDGKWLRTVSKATNGVFHQWGSAYEEFETNAGNFSIAIIELSDGTIKNVPVENVKFMKGIV